MKNIAIGLSGAIVGAGLMIGGSFAFAASLQCSTDTVNEAKSLLLMVQAAQPYYSNTPFPVQRVVGEAVHLSQMVLGTRGSI